MPHRWIDSIAGADLFSIFFDKMDSELRRSSTRDHIKKRELSIDLSNLATSYVRQNNALRKTLRRLEQENQKQMKSIDGDIWELQKFMQELTCVTAMSAEDIMPYWQRKPKERRTNTSIDETLSGISQTGSESETSLNTDSLLPTAPSITATGQSVGNDETRNEEPLADNLDRQSNSFWRMHERRRCSSVGEMSSDTQERLKTFAVCNQPLLYRRRSLDAEKHVQSLLHRRKSSDAGNQPLLQQRRSLTAGNEPCFHPSKSLDLINEAGINMSFERNAQKAGTGEPTHVRKNNRLKVWDRNEQLTTNTKVTDSNSDKGFNFENENGSCRKYSMFYQRPPSFVIEEAIVETDEVDRDFHSPRTAKSEFAVTRCRRNTQLQRRWQTTGAKKYL